MSFADPLSPFQDPHREDDNAPPWPTTPHSPTSPHPTLVKPVTAATPTAAATPVTGTGPWGREPQIYGQPEPGLISPREAIASNGTNFEKPEPYLRVRITSLDRNRRDILIRFDAQTNLPTFTGTTYRNVSRSYAEFQRFYEQIVYSNPQTIIPALPLAQTSAPSDEEDDRLVKVMLQRWFSRVCDDQILLSDEELRSFIESDFGYQPMPRQRRKGGSSFSLLGRRPPDEDEELARARFELTRLETQYIEAAKAVDRLSQSRKAMSFAHADMGNKLVDVAAAEVHPPLASAVRKMGRSWHTYADLDQAQAISDCVILGDSLGYQGMNARSAKETLLQRGLALEEYQDAVKNTIAKRRNIERLKASANIRPERVDDALEELEEANKVEQHLHKRVEGISQNLHRALHTHSRLAHEDITAALIEHARTNIMYERQILRELESLQPDVKVAADPAPPASALPAAAAIAPLAAAGRSATLPSLGTFQRAPVTTGHFLPPEAKPQPPPVIPAIVAPTPSPFVPPAQVPVAVSVAGSSTSPKPTSPAPTRPAFPKTSQFVSSSIPGLPPAPSTPSVTQNSSPITPSFPRTSQFLPNPNTSPMRASTPTLGGYNVFPRTSQFIPNAQSSNLPSSRPTTATQNHVVPSTPPRQPNSPTIYHQQPIHPQQQQNHATDPLGTGSRIISSPATPPKLPMAASMASLPSASLRQSPAPSDPLTGGSMTQSMYATYTPSQNYDPLGGVGVTPLGGTMRGIRAAQTPTRSRLDAREAASKLANFL